MSIQETLKDAGGIVFGLAFILALSAIGVALLYGAAEISVWALEWMPDAFAWIVWTTLLILVPISLIPAARGYAGIGFVVASFLFGVILWIFCMAYTYETWGLFAVIVGLVFLGVGAVPIAILAAIINGMWGVLGNIALLIVVTFVSRFVGYWLAEKADERAARIARAHVEPMKIKPAKRPD